MPAARQREPLSILILDSRLHGNDKLLWMQATPACVPAMSAGTVCTKRKQTTGYNRLWSCPTHTQQKNGRVIACTITRPYHFFIGWRPGRPPQLSIFNCQFQKNGASLIRTPHFLEWGRHWPDERDMHAPVPHVLIRKAKLIMQSDGFPVKGCFQTSPTRRQ